MNALTQKLGVYNALAESQLWNDDNVATTKPPALSIAPAPIDFVNITGAANVTALLIDGDQNLPVTFSASPTRVKIDFGVAYKPAFIALINHNYYEAGDTIEFLGGAASPAVNSLITLSAGNANRSVDLFYPLRFNDAYCNVADVSYRHWEIEFTKGSGYGYLGQVFVAAERYSFIELSHDAYTPGANYGTSFSPARRDVRHVIDSGEAARYDLRPQIIDIDLRSSQKGDDETYKLLNHAGRIGAVMSRRSPCRSVLVSMHDRVCHFGKLDRNNSIGRFAPDTISRNMDFIAENPREFQGYVAP